MDTAGFVEERLPAGQSACWLKDPASGRAAITFIDCMCRTYAQALSLVRSHIAHIPCAIDSTSTSGVATYKLGERSTDGLALAYFNIVTRL